MGVIITVEPTTEPVTSAEAKAYARVDISDDDTLIAEVIKAARRQCERWLKRKFITTTLALKLDGFPAWEICPPYPPLLAISSVTYTDTAAASQTISSAEYVVDTASEPGRLTPAYGEIWPNTYDQMNAVVITYTAGFGATAASVPEDIKIAIKLLVNHYYEQRLPTELVMKSAYDMIDAYRYGEYFSVTLSEDD